MNPQQMIFQHHLNMAKATSKIYTNQSASVDIVSQSIGKNDPNHAAKLFSNHFNIPLKLAQALVKATDKNWDINKEKKTYELLGDDYIVVSPTLSELFNDQKIVGDELEIFRRAQRAKASIFNQGPTILYRYKQYQFMKLMLATVGKTISLDYWLLDQDLDMNLDRAGLAGRKLAHLFIDVTNQILGSSDVLRDLWDKKYLMNVINGVDFREHIRNVISKGAEYTNVTALVYKLWLSVMRPHFTNHSEWHNYQPSVAIPVLFWLADYKQWFADNTLVFAPEMEGKISVNHHEVVTYFCTNSRVAKNATGKFTRDTHPKDAFATLIAHVAQNKAAELTRGNRLSYPRALPGFEKLPKEWDYFRNNFRSITEGQTMSHCCGGKSYISECIQGDSIFFHVENEHQDGLTVQLRKTNGTNFISPNDENLLFRFFNFGTADFYKVQQVKGRRNRSPSDQEQRNYIADLLLAQDLESISKVTELSCFSIIMENSYRVVSIDDSQANTILSDAYRHGYFYKAFRDKETAEKETFEVFEEMRLGVAIIENGGDRYELSVPVERFILPLSKERLTIQPRFPEINLEELYPSHYSLNQHHQKCDPVGRVYEAVKARLPKPELTAFQKEALEDLSNGLQGILDRREAQRDATMHRMGNFHRGDYGLAAQANAIRESAARHRAMVGTSVLGKEIMETTLMERKTVKENMSKYPNIMIGHPILGTFPYSPTAIHLSLDDSFILKKSKSRTSETTEIQLDLDGMERDLNNTGKLLDSIRQAHQTALGITPEMIQLTPNQYPPTTATEAQAGGMFGAAGEFQENLNPWDTSRVVDMSDMFGTSKIRPHIIRSNPLHRVMDLAGSSPNVKPIVNPDVFANYLNVKLNRPGPNIIHLPVTVSLG